MASSSPSPGQVLVVDDEPSSRELLDIILNEEGFTVESASSGPEALQILANGTHDLVVSDLQMPGMDGLELTQQIRERHPDTEVLILTAFGSQERAHEAGKLQADYLRKPFDKTDLLHRIARLVEKSRMATELAELRDALKGKRATQAILAESRPMRAVLDQVQAIARSNYPVLVTGESGTGKELVAQSVHDASSRASGPFVPVNCGAIPETLFETELFGHVKGAFTGADAPRAGLFEEADGGTIFLDEVGEISLEGQVKLLRVLQSSEIKRVGSSQTQQVDLRVVCATNRDLADMVEQGTFRQDLYYRLNVLPLHLPPLRERPEDVALLARHFLAQANEELEQPSAGFTPEALEKLSSHRWPGNVRELENKVRQAAMLAGGAHIGADHVVFVGSPVAGASVGGGGERSSAADPSLTYEEARERFERDYLLACLRQHSGQVTRAAEAMGIHRNSVYHMLRKHEIDPSSFR
ncbi:MAG: sigma-54 dependent transcriptional regulator [Acidobacteriota bacterium]